ncbi:transcription factor E2F7 [Nilaparvata lugens]|uniref:transcription factor E2F7 n=1 Tax=Nilaparvata lugens TaxID=108931 RepID=UPI00193D7BF1|nr:transcription factor E2F7 [Nilaparvata lugens]
MESENKFYSDAGKITPKRQALRDLSNGDSPVSPMANFKLLIKVATNQSSFIESQSQSLKFSESQSESLKFTDSQSESLEFAENQSESVKFVDELPKIRPDSPSSEDNKGYGPGYVRKNKSLGFLCVKFLKMFPLDMKKGHFLQISLNHLAKELGVEKRRVYDIINIVESLAMAEKVSKDTYKWYGNQNLAQAMGLFSQYARVIGLDTIMRKAQEGESLNRGVYRDLFEEKLISSITRDTKCLLDNRRLGVLCQKFIMLLLASHQQNSLVSLNAAVSLLVSETELIKTRQRRLYDIANILQSLHLIRRVFPSSSRPAARVLKRPVFAYSGPRLQKVSLNLGCVNDNCQTIANHSSNTIESETETQLDTSYIEPQIDQKQPAAKKRLVFKPELRKIPSSNVILKPFDLYCQPNKVAPPSIEPGACYRAVKMGSSVHLIKIQ